MNRRDAIKTAVAGAAGVASDFTPQAEASMHCGTCRWWDGSEECGWGYCKRNAPIVPHEHDIYHDKWVRTEPHDWCGEWKEL